MNDGPQINKADCGQVGTRAQPSNTHVLPTSLCIILFQKLKDKWLVSDKEVEFASGCSEYSKKYHVAVVALTGLFPGNSMEIKSDAVPVIFGCNILMTLLIPAEREFE